MKKLFGLLLITFFVVSYAQERYQYVIVPQKFDGFNGKENPYGLSSSTHYLLKKQNIKTFYQEQMTIVENPCNGLKANIQNTSSMFRNKLRFVLENCTGQEVFSAEGTGKSKEFKEGYTEALQEAVSKLHYLPYKDNGTQLTETELNTVPPTVNQTTPKPPVADIIETTNEYVAKNMYFNNTYMFDVITEKEKKYLKIINGELLGYTKLQTIGTLSPSGIENTYLIEWTTPNNKTINGIAKFSENELQISLPSEQGNKLIIVKQP